MSDPYYGDYPVTFYFSVIIANTGKPDVSFSEVAGLKSKLETEDFKEVGSPTIHKLPTRVTHEDLVLKRSIASTNSALVKWCKTTLEDPFANKIKPRDVTVNLLNPSGEPARTWSFIKAYPVAWEADSFAAEENKLSIETITLKHAGMIRKK